MSKKQDKIKRELIKVYKEIALEREPCCSGCNRYDVPLSHSHIIPRSRRPDLVLKKRNIQYQCLSIGERTGCHTIWESKQRDQLLDYFSNLAYIKEVDLEYYYLITDDT
jgi:hypothetical protein|tara:strand:- start:154 stop:480 length:327 start_codon:yes stop_codon:yes gene_type:complete